VLRPSLTISAKPDGVGAAFQRWTRRGEQSGLLTRIATTGKCYVVRADEKLTAFMELESAIPGLNVKPFCLAFLFPTI
jgi:hypothetical protein